MKTALIQTTSSDDPARNRAMLSEMITEAANQGAQFVLTPEVSNCISMSRAHQKSVLRFEDEDETLSAMRALAADKGIHLLIGSLGVQTGDPDGRFANRSFLIDPAGEILARYDKIHMFDVDIDAAETFRESDGYRPGKRAVLAQTSFAPVGMCICYDVRFPLLANALARAGAQVLTYPAAFSPVTGAAHWHSLLRARAIETGTWVLAPAQTGSHSVTSGPARQTYGHSLAVDPWGEVVVDAGTAPGIYYVDLDMKRVEDARRRVPALMNAQSFGGP